MRNFFMLLLLVNMLAFAYQKWIIQPDNPVAATFVEQNYPRLTAVRLQRTPPPEPVAVVKNGENVAKCLQIGPISRENDAISLLQQLRESGVAATRSTAPGQVWVGHWVQVTGLADRAAALAARDQLVAAGLSDAYIVSGDPLKISLGVFKSAASVDKTIAQARRLGFSTRKDERFQSATQHWLLVTLPEGRELRPGELRGDTGQILRTESVPCLDAQPPAP